MLTALKNQAEDISRSEQKWIVFFLKQEQQYLLFHSVVKIRPCLCDTRQHCVPDSSAGFKQFGMAKQQSAFPCGDTALTYRNTVILIPWQNQVRKTRCSVTLMRL